MSFHTLDAAVFFDEAFFFKLLQSTAISETFKASIKISGVMLLALVTAEEIASLVYSHGPNMYAKRYKKAKHVCFMPRIVRFGILI